MSRSEINYVEPNFNTKNHNRTMQRFSDREDKIAKKKEKGKELFMQHVENSKDTKKNNQMVNKGSSSYLSQPNVKDFNKTMQKRIFNSCGIGRPYAFSDLDELEKEMSEFFDLCSDKQIVPTITNLALWLGVDRDTIYAHARNNNSPFSLVMKNCINYLHSIMQSGTVDGKINPVTYIFISKNDYGMRDDKNITVTPTTGDNTINNQATMSALQKQLEEENVPNATFTEND